MRQRLKLHQERAVTHKLTAIVAALVCVLVHCISVTYFIGTNRWCKEVAAAYRLDPDCVRRSNRLKARSFPWSFAGVLSVLAIIALGAACDPTTQRQTTWQWVQPHFWGALAGTAFIVASFLNQWMNIQAHSELVDAVLREVQRIRLEHGLEVATSVR
jgi:drug/metabolite transporter (DMT)-like permease